MHLEHRSWVPFIVIGLSVLLVAVYIVWGEPIAESRSNAVSQVESVDSSVDPDEYKGQVNTLLGEFEVAQDAGQTYEELLNVTVPAQYREIHLELVIAMSEYRAGKIESAQARIDFLKQQVDWLN